VFPLYESVPHDKALLLYRGYCLSVCREVNGYDTFSQLGPLHGCLALKKQSPPQDPTVALCVGS